MQRCHQNTLSQDASNWMDHIKKVSEAVVFITGGNRSLGLAIAWEARRQGAKEIYVGMRQIGSFQEERLTPIQLDVNDEVSIQQAAEQCADTTILVNNAGIALLNEHPVDANIIATTKKDFGNQFVGLDASDANFCSDLEKEPTGLCGQHSLGYILGVKHCFDQLCHFQGGSMVIYQLKSSVVVSV